MSLPVRRGRKVIRFEVSGTDLLAATLEEVLRWAYQKYVLKRETPVPAQVPVAQGWCICTWAYSTNECSFTTVGGTGLLDIFLHGVLKRLMGLREIQVPSDPSDPSVPFLTTTSRRVLDAAT